MNYKKIFDKIKILGDADYKDYMKYLDEIDIDEVKNLKYKYKYKTIQSNKFFDSLLTTISIASIYGIMNRTFNFIADILKNKNQIDENLIQTLVLGSLFFSFIICFIILFLVWFLHNFLTNRSKKLAMINEYLKNKIEKEREK